MKKQDVKIQGHGFFRKTKVGLASGIVLGTVLFFGANAASADEVNAGNTANNANVAAVAPKPAEAQPAAGAKPSAEVEPVEVAKIENTQKPSDSADADGTYNSQVKSVETIKVNEEANSVRYRVDFHDEHSIPNGGKVQFETTSSRQFVEANDLYIDKTKVGTVTAVATSGTDPELVKSLASKETLKDFKKELNEASSKEVLGTSRIELKFNEEFAKLNKNRAVEFTLDFKPKSDKFTDLPTLYTTQPDKVDVFDGGKTYKTYKNTLSLPSVKDKALVAPKTTAVYPIKDVRTTPVNETVHSVTTHYNLTVNSPASKKLPIYLQDVNYIAPLFTRSVNSPTADFDRITERNVNNNDQYFIKKGDILELKAQDAKKHLLDLKAPFKVGDIVSGPFVEVYSSGSANGVRFTDTNVYKKDGALKATKIPLTAKVLEVSESGVRLEMQEDVKTANNAFSIFNFNTPATSLTSTLRSDWLSRFTEDRLKSFLSGPNARVDLNSEEGYGFNVSLTRNGSQVFKNVGPTAVAKNTNLTFGESTKGTVKVRYVDENMKEIPGYPTETVLDNKPWYTSVTITPKSIKNYEYQYATAPLSTIAGSGEQVISLVYKAPAPNEDIPVKEEVTKIYEPDPNLDPGVQKVDKQGKPKKTKGDKVVDPGEPQVIKVGNKPKVVEEEIPFNKTTKENPNLPEGESKVIQVGKNGKKKTTTTYTVDPKTGKVTPNEPTVETVPPVDEITEVGKGKDKDGDLKITYIPDPESPEGNQTVVDPGKKPKYDVTGKEKDPGKPKVVKVGNKPKVVEEEIPFNKTTKENPNLPEGESKVIQVGKNGKKKTTTTYTVDPKTGKVTPNEPTVETVPPVDEITEVGKGKDKDGDLKITYIPDPESPEGNQTIVDQGKKPKYDVTGKEKDPGKPKVIKVGNKPKVVVEEIPFKEVTVENPSKPEGYRAVLKEGKVGKKTTTTTYTVDPNTGKVTPNEPTVTIVKAEDALIEIGTGKNFVGEIETRYVPDIELEFGKTKIVQNGTPEVKDVTGKVLTPGTPTIIHIGIKPKVDEEDIEFKVVKRDNPELPKGQEKVVQEGEKGKKTTTTTYTVDPKTGKVTSNVTVETKDPQDKIIEVGTKEEAKVTPAPQTPKTPQAPAPQVAKAELPNTGEKASSALMVAGLAMAAMTVGFVAKGRKEEN